MKLDAEDLKAFEPLIEAVIRRVLAETGSGLKLFTEAEVAQELGLGPFAIRDARRRGEIQGSLICRKWKYTRAQIDAYIRRSAQK